MRRRGLGGAWPAPAQPFVKANRACALAERTWTLGGPLSALTLANGLRDRRPGR